MTKQAQAKAVCAALAQEYPGDIKCYLNYETPWQLLAATILSAQCTDIRVNQTTPLLFAAYADAAATAAADIYALEDIIRPCGLSHTKARHIINAARQITELGGELPRAIEALTAIDGVGRKTANVIRGEIFKDPCVVVDTHVSRVSRRLGLAQSEGPAKIEQELMAVLPKAHWIVYNHRVIAHGRAVCKAPKPKCGLCRLSDLCDLYKGGIT